MTNNPSAVTALNTINRLMPLVDQVEGQFKSARNWSFIDLFGGDTISGLVKHYKLSKAQSTMSEIDYLLKELNSQLNNINIPDGYNMQLNGFLTFADFLFDGVLVDAYMTSKIMSSLDQVRQLKQKLQTLKSNLENL